MPRHKKSCIGNEELFSCEKCDYEATRKDHLSDHIKRHHEKVILTCDKCEYSTERLDYLQNHKYYMHVNVNRKKIKKNS